MGAGDDTDGPVLEVGVLGPLRPRVAGQERPFPAGRPGRLLAALLLADGRPLSAEQLVDAVWGQAPPDDARAALHTTVARVRRVLGPAAALLVRQGSGYALRSDGVASDAAMFRAAVADARRRGDLAAFDAAAAWWRGPPWDGLDADPARADAVQLRDSWLAAQEDRAELLLRHGRAAEAVPALRALVREAAFRERPALLLVQALDAAGDVGGALAAYDEHRRMLADELGLDPSPQLATLHRQALERSLRHPAPSVVPAGGLDSGSMRSLPAVPGLHGREAALLALRSVLAGQRCVTVVGPGGVGKTSVAVTLVRQWRDGGVWWVDLAQVSDPAAVQAVVADALDVARFPGAELQQAWQRRLETARGLLVLDNCEHLLAASGDVAADVLAGGTGLRVLATSRERLGLPQEQVFLLPPLQLPGPGGADLAAMPAVALFLERAAAAGASLPTDPQTVAMVAELVRALDGLPLAIELAAGRLQSVTLHDLRALLSERVDVLGSSARRAHRRHRILTATVAWSYDLLDEEQQRVFAGLSVFAGSFDLAAAEAVLGVGAPAVVADLVERSLVVGPGATGVGHYRLLETLRTFARGSLTDADAVEVARRHTAWAVDLACRADAGLRGAEEAVWATRLDEALSDLSAAFQRALGDGDVTSAAGLVCSLQRWAYLRVRVDVLGWARQVLDAAGGVPASVYASAANHAWMAGRFDTGRQLAQRGMAAAGGPDAAAAVPCLDALGDLELAVGDLAAAGKAYAASAATAAAHGDLPMAVQGRCGQLLVAAFGAGPVDELRDRLLQEMARVDNPTALAWAHYALGESSADPVDAHARFAEARQLAQAAGNRVVVGVSMVAETALVAAALGLDRRSVELAVTAVRHWSGSGNENLLVTCLRTCVPLLSRLGAHRAVVELAAALAAVTEDRPSYGAEAQRLTSALTAAGEVLGASAEQAWHSAAPRSTVQAADLVAEELSLLAATL